MILVAVDLSNLFFCVRDKFNGRRINYRKFLHFAIGETTEYKAIAYGSAMDGNADNFKEALTHLGFELRFKEPKTYISRAGKEVRKSDWDVAMAIELIERLDEFDTLVLGSADGDMAAFVEYIKKQGKKCHVIASGISRDLRNASNQWTEITEGLLQ